MEFDFRQFEEKEKRRQPENKGIRIPIMAAEAPESDDPVMEAPADMGLRFSRTELKRCTVVPFLIVFFFLNALCATILNFYMCAREIDKNYFFSVDLRPNLSMAQEEALEKQILSVYGVKNVRYVSRDASFRDLQTQLGIALPESENSLADSMIVWFRNKSDLSNLQERLEAMADVKETYIDLLQIQYRENEVKFYKLLIVILFGIFFAPLLILTGFIFYNGFSLEYANKIDESLDERKLRRRAKWVNVLPMLVCVVISSLVFVNAYLYFGDLLLTIRPEARILSLRELLIPQSVGVLGICLFIAAVPFWPLKKSGGET